jgi:hypothetical protein
MFVRKLGYRKANWLPCCKILLVVLFILNVFACYARPDFITQLVCVMSAFFLTDNDNISRDKFRTLPLLILFSIVYDVIYLFFIQNMAKEGNAEGGLESPVKNFALQMSYVQFIFKVSSHSFFSQIIAYCVLCPLESVLQLPDRYQANTRRTKDNQTSKDC